MQAAPSSLWRLAVHARDWRSRARRTRDSREATRALMEDRSKVTQEGAQKAGRTRLLSREWGRSFDRLKMVSMLGDWRDVVERLSEPCCRNSGDKDLVVEQWFLSKEVAVDAVGPPSSYLRWSVAVGV